MKKIYTKFNWENNTTLLANLRTYLNEIKIANCRKGQITNALSWAISNSKRDTLKEVVNQQMKLSNDDFIIWLNKEFNSYAK